MTPELKSVPTEHEDAYSEMCQQFMRGVLRAYADAQSITIMRELPRSLQVNALMVGALVGGLIPTLLSTSLTDDDVIRAMTKALPEAVRSARARASQIEKLLPYD